MHRDVKPYNVMLDEGGRVVVTDFGIARMGASALTRTGAMLGTSSYLSPEQAQGRSADERSDLYSLGVVLYEMLTGRLPFSGESDLAVAMQHVSVAPPNPRTSRRDLRTSRRGRHTGAQQGCPATGSRRRASSASRCGAPGAAKAR